MKLLNYKFALATLSAGLLATITLLPEARSALIYEQQAPAPSGLQATVAAPAQTVVVTPAQPAAATTVAAPAPTTVVVTPVRAAAPAAVAAAPAPVPAAPVAAPAAVAAAPAPVAQVISAPAAAPAMAPATAAAQVAIPVGQPAVEAENLPKSEELRRERIRLELQNEDVLQQKLEESRLNDEKNRINELTGGQPAQAAAAPTAAPVKDELVVAPATEHPGAPAEVPVVTPAMTEGTGVKVASMGDIGTGGSQPVMVSTASESGTTSSGGLGLSLTPRIGVANFSGQTPGIAINPTFSAGAELGIRAGDNLTVVLGYSYNQYGMSLNSSSGLVQALEAEAGMYGYSNANFSNVTMNQNVFDAGLKLSLLGPDAKFRPYVSAGGAYAASYINHSSQILALMNQMGSSLSSYSLDYDLSQYMAYAGVGFDVQIARNLAITAGGRYYTVLASNQTQNIMPTYYGAYNSLNMDQQMVGTSLASTGIYVIQGGVSLTF